MKQHKKTPLVLAVVLVLAGAVAFASVSLSTGVVLPGWEKVDDLSIRTTASKLARDIASDLPNVSCIVPDVHYRAGASLWSRELYVDTWFEGSGKIFPLVEQSDYHVLLFKPSFGLDNHVVIVMKIDDGLLLIAC